MLFNTYGQLSMAYLVDRVVTGQEMDREKNSSRSGKSQEILF